MNHEEKPEKLNTKCPHKNKTQRVFKYMFSYRSEIEEQMLEDLPAWPFDQGHLQARHLCEVCY